MQHQKVYSRKEINEDAVSEVAFLKIVSMFRTGMDIMV